MLRGGTGGKETSTEGMSAASGITGLNLVLCFGTGRSFLIPSSNEVPRSSDFLSTIICRCLGTGLSIKPSSSRSLLSSTKVKCGSCNKVGVSHWPRVLLRLDRMRLWCPGRLMPICSSRSWVNALHSCSVVSPALRKTSSYCSRRSTLNQSGNVRQESDWDVMFGKLQVTYHHFTFTPGLRFTATKHSKYSEFLAYFSGCDKVLAARLNSHAK